MPETLGTETPYPGLRPFEAHEADVFFGREAHTDRLLEILQRERFLGVIGPSGSGKSSLVRAGLLPSLRMGALGSGSDWRIAVLRPGDQPVRSLAAALLQPDVFGPELSGSAMPEVVTSENVAMVAAELRRGPLGLLHATESARAARANLLVIVDQFEEIFTYAEAGDETADESEAFVNLLLAARTDPLARIYVVLTMRTDFLGNCVRFPELPDAINRAQYLTPRLKRPEMERAIVGPAEVFGGSVDPSLVAEIINATGQSSDQLPLLQHALARMWAHAAQRDQVSPVIGWEDAKAVGGLTGALDQHAESVLSDVLTLLGAEGEPLVAAMFCAITERRSAASGGQDVRRPQTLARIAAACGVQDWKTLAPIVRAYAAPDVSLLQHGRTLDEHSVIDLSHEALMRQWARLSRWVDAESRRSSDYRRWTERAMDHAGDRGGLLEGAALVRATEWLAGEVSSGQTGWRPTPTWAARYATTADADAEFRQTVGFIEESVASLRRKEQEEQDTLERERRAAIERAQEAEHAARKALRRAILVAFLLFALAAASLYFYVQAKGAADQARRAEADALEARNTAQELAKETQVLREKADAQLKIAAGEGQYTTSEGQTRSPGVARALSLADLAAVMPGSTEPLRRAYLDPLNAAMAEFGIDTPLRQAHFLGQMSYESGDLRGTEEKWGPTEAQNRYESTVLAKSIGNVQPGDGERYRGRGLIWIIGRGNYEKYGAALGLDLVKEPDLAARPDVAVRTAGLFWKLTRLNDLADTNDIAAITRKIGDGRNVQARTIAVERAKKVLGIASVPTE